MSSDARPTLAVWKFASCDGCQLSLLDCEDELLAVTDRLEIANFPEASSAIAEGPYDISLVEGSITTPHDAERIRAIRKQSGLLLTIGACATAGGIQALRNFANFATYPPAVYPHPEYLRSLSTSSPIAHHVQVDGELRGCPISKEQLLEAISALLFGRRPYLPRDSVCVECKRRGTGCVMVSLGVPCLGAVTQAGCGAICPAFRRGCYGCFGPSDSANGPAMTRLLESLGDPPETARRRFLTFNAAAPEFAMEGRRDAR